MYIERELDVEYFRDDDQSRELASFQLFFPCSQQATRLVEIHVINMLYVHCIHLSSVPAE